MRSRIAFFAVIGIAIVVVIASQLIGTGGGGSDKKDVIVVNGFIGSEKKGFLDNPQIQDILRDRYGLEVDYTSLGSIEQVMTDSSSMDFLWPSNDVALAIYEENHTSRVKSETIFRSPIVLYSWAEVTDVLINQGLVTQENDIYYADMEALIRMAVETDTTWQDLGMSFTHPKKLNIISTDPIKSNSGNMFYGLMANILAPDEIANDTTIEQVLPAINAYYDGLGMLADGSNDLFANFISTGMGANPLIVNYESLLIEFTLQYPQYRDVILAELRTIYPRPTVWSNHPLIALTPEGEQLMAALQDEEIQKIAWTEHGFRSGLVGITNDPSELQVGNIPDNIVDVLALPRPSVMERIINELATP